MGQVGEQEFEREPRMAAAPSLTVADRPSVRRSYADALNQGPVVASPLLNDVMFSWRDLRNR
jgi:hypothetical protein